MNKLIVFCGPIGCGKTTFIKEFLISHPDLKYLDVFNYIKKHKDEVGHLEPSGSLAAYQEFYQDLKKVTGDIIIEIGTNREGLNMDNLKELKNDHQVNIFFCLLDDETCIARVLARAEEDPEKIIHESDLREKFKRVFPDSHIKLAQDFGLTYHPLDMSLSFEERAKIIEEIL